jgi:demethylmenaquinone methyltransferase/2-methoxy-6-polyprenyl-1,4-benzoquinol methylase
VNVVGRRDRGAVKTGESGRPVAGTLPHGDEKRATVKAMFDSIAPRYDLLNRIISLGLDQSWRRRTVKALGLPPGAVVLDLACGTGDMSVILSKRGLVPIGVDLSGGMLRHSRAPTPQVNGDAVSLPFRDRSFDGVVCGFGLRNFTDIAAVAKEMARIVRPGGRIALLEVAIPASAAARAGYSVWFEHAVPAIGSLISDQSAYRYLPDSVEYLPAPERLRSILREAGFSAVGRRTFGAGATQVLSGTRVGTPRNAGTAKTPGSA